jgi:hypothetical protein
MFTSSLVDIPRPFIDSIDTLIEALGIASLSMMRPRVNGTIAVVTDTRRRGIGMLHLPELNTQSAHDIVSRCSRIENVHSVILVSVRTVSLVQPHDADLLLHLSTLLSHAGIHLHDWVITGHGGLYCPRSLLGLVDPWLASPLFL